VPKADILRCGKERRYSITSSARERDEFSAVSSAALFGPLSRYQEHQEGGIKSVLIFAFSDPHRSRWRPPHR
jgi:hypothetical protein